MASNVDISNAALSHLGSDAVVASLSPPDGSVEAGHCARFLPMARQELIEPHPWAFAMTRVALALEATNASDVWAYAYRKPSNCLRAWRVLRTGDDADTGVATLRFDDMLVLPNERDTADFVVEGQTIYTHEPEAVLLFSTDVTDPSRMPPLAVTALSYLLAAYLAGPLIKGSEGADTARRYRKMAADLGAMATMSNANIGAETSEHVAAHLRARA